MMEISTREKNIWIELIVMCGISIYYLWNVYQLNGWEQVTGSDVGSVIVKVIIISIVSNIALAMIFNSKQEEKDERDIAIEVKGNNWGYYSLLTLICMVIGHIMLNEGAAWFFSDRVMPNNAPFIMHLLLIAMLISTFIKYVVELVCYRKGF